MGSLNGRSVLITGGARGIGKAVALACAREGARVVIAARTRTEVEGTTAELRKLVPSSQGVVADVSNEDDVARLFGESGTIDSLVCAAAITGPIGPVEENPVADWIHAFEINVFGTLRCVRAAIPGMRKTGGRIVLFSGGGQGPMERRSAYVTSKGAIWRLTETLGAELGPTGIFVNAIAPGAVNTKLLRDAIDAGPERAGKEAFAVARKQAQDGGTPPEKAAELAVWLMSDAARGLVGKTLSAVWDDYRAIQEPSALAPELYTFKRVIRADGGTR